MAAPRVGEQTRQRLQVLLRNDRVAADALMRRLRQLRRLDEVPACSETVRLLANLEVSEAEAERLLLDLLQHRRGLTAALGRDPGLRVATVDFLSNVEPLLTNPKIVEMSEFEQTERSAVTDPLTALYNRRYFRSAMRREVRRSHRYGLGFSLVLLDLDDFKRVNDEHGHVLGDLVLRRVARLIRKAVREADVPCRYGGEEFAVILPETDRLGTYTVAERIRRRVQSSFDDRPTGGRRIPLTLSGGIACFPEDGSEAAALISRADETLYRAKGAGRNRVLLHPTERRRSVRYPARPNVRLALQRPGESAPHRVGGVNLSVDGALVESAPGWSVSEPVRFLLDAHDDAGRASTVEAQVVRIETDAEEAAGRTRIGVAFERPLPERLLMRHVFRGAGFRRVGGGRS